MIFFKRVNALFVCGAVLIINSIVLNAEPASLVLSKQSFTKSDSILVVEEGLGDIKAWQASKEMVPASLTKLSTAYLALDKWGVDHAFQTDFYRFNNELWVKGYGDPYLVSEELDLLVQALASVNLDGVTSLHIDDSYFLNELVPGRSKVDDPYNAPLSAVAANFNTVMLKKSNGTIQSAESQTPLTKIASQLAKNLQPAIQNNAKAQRVNLKHRDNAQTHFAQLLITKHQQLITKHQQLITKHQQPEKAESLIEDRHVSWGVNINGRVPEGAKLLYRYTNTKKVEQIIRGMLEFSNNFMANQLFLSLGGTIESGSVSFKQASDYAQKRLKELFEWDQFCVVEGSGLSRDNQLSARQIDDLLVGLKPHKHLFKQTKHPTAEIFAKTGTLKGVRTFAGFIGLNNKEYRFVFMFNRKVPWRHREQLLETLVDELISLQKEDKQAGL